MFMPGDSVVVTSSFKTRMYDEKKWRKAGNGTFRAGATGVCLGCGKYVIQYGPFRSVRWGVVLSDSDAAKNLAKQN
jgi:hypothetical protein